MGGPYHFHLSKIPCPLNRSILYNDKTMQSNRKSFLTSKVPISNSCKMKVTVCFYIAQYPVRWTAQSALHFTPLTDLFIPTPSILATQQFCAKIFIHISTTVHSHVLIYTAEWTEASWREQKCPNFETVAKEGFEHGLSRL